MKLLRYISVLILCIGLSACGEDNPYTPEPTPPTPPTPPTEKENIAFTIDGNLIRAGKGKTGDIVYNIDGEYVKYNESIYIQPIYSFGQLDKLYVSTLGNTTLYVIQPIYSFGQLDRLYLNSL